MSTTGGYDGQLYPPLLGEALPMYEREREHDEADEGTEGAQAHGAYRAPAWGGGINHASCPYPDAAHPEVPSRSLRSANLQCCPCPCPRPCPSPAVCYHGLVARAKLSASLLVSLLGRADVASLCAVVTLTLFVVQTLLLWSYRYFQLMGATGRACGYGVLALRLSLVAGFSASDFLRPRYNLRQWKVVLACTLGAAVGVGVYLSAFLVSGKAVGLGGSSSGGGGGGVQVDAAVAVAVAGIVLTGLCLSPLPPLCLSASYSLPGMTPGTGVCLVLLCTYLGHILAALVFPLLGGRVAALLPLLCVTLVPLLRCHVPVPTALCLVIDVDAFQLPVPHDVAVAGERASMEW